MDVEEAFCTPFPLFRILESKKRECIEKRYEPLFAVRQTDTLASEPHLQKYLVLTQIDLKIGDYERGCRMWVVGDG